MPRIPRAILLAGPNGAGKSTSKPGFLPDTMAFLNADDIARDLGGMPETKRDMAAGRLLLNRLSTLEEAREDFALETNLGSRGLAVRIPKWQEAGYRVTLLYLCLPSDDLAVARVAQRVRAGGHSIPEPTIRRRYRVGLRNLFEVYLPLVDIWRLYENADERGPRLVAHGSRNIALPWIWQQVRQVATGEAA